MLDAGHSIFSWGGGLHNLREIPLWLEAFKFWSFALSAWHWHARSSHLSRPVQNSSRAVTLLFRKALRATSHARSPTTTPWKRAGFRAAEVLRFTPELRATPPAGREEGYRILLIC